MGELLSIKNLFISSHEKSVEELKIAIEGLIGKAEIENRRNKNERKYDMIKDYLDANKNNILHFAVYGNNFNNVKFIVENTNLINSFNNDERNSLIISILNKNTEISKYLIDNNIDYNKTDKYKSNALLYSLITQNYDIFNILIEKENIDININSFDKGNLISICIFERNIKILKKLFNKNISPDFEKNIYPHPLIFITYSNDNDLLYLYLTYSLYYYTKNEELYKINKTNFDDKTNEIIIDLENRHIINDSILNDKKYDLTTFKKLLNLKDENDSSLLDICTQNNNNIGRNILLYYSKSE
ncbi:conserved Plasmodium protein, unknown function [Plasmodium relictum]|uniref:Uncharacterized protein n=1 Tax=Plasmodium relictum TaxID=85471 RepID=A0A1J1HFQ5_PLARL|nr:conserved Plasmodium protein, unknown function [Plasmodium relictum]CRH02874.1 conserved Plasmodium protein, unknown function [Plasmodium relictum]